VATSAALGRCRLRVERICASGGDDRTLRLQLLDEIRRVVGFDAHAWLLTDPETCVGSAPLADVPCLPELPRLIRLKYLTDLGRWTAPHRPAVVLLRQATDGDPSRSLLWRELLARYGVDDVASAVFRDRFGSWGFLDLWRAGGTFDADEAALLADVAAPVARALRRAQADTFGRGPAPGGRRSGPVVLLLSPDLQVLGQTPATHDYLRTLLPPPEGLAPVPAGAYNVAAQLVAVEAGVDDHPAWARVHLADGRWLTMRAARIGDAAPGGARDIAVTIEEASPSERTGLVATAFGLSNREREVLGHLMSGCDTRELAGRLFLSEYTVQDHLRSVFAKTGTHHRRALLSLVLGT
jgi:DNA-binding CsgD family transcriptional regulator